MKYKSLITSLAALFSFLIFSQNAYAASYINVSSGSGGTVSLGSIKPSSTGISASGSDTLTITTNCSAGYKIYVSAQENGDTNLTNANKSITSNNIISTSETTVGSTATTLNSNTWGINSENNNVYVGLPAYADATTTALITTSSADTSGDNKNTIYYGVKVDTTLTPGTYSGDVLYTALVASNCEPYTIQFNANGGTGTMPAQSIDAIEPTALDANSFIRPDFAFLGWSTSEKGKTGTATNGIGTTADVDYTDEEILNSRITDEDNITLYAIWQSYFYHITTMQEMTSSICALATTPSSSATTYDDAGIHFGNTNYVPQRTLIDTRDNNSYLIRKLSDGNCWMISNLALGSPSKSYLLTPEDSDVTTNFTLPIAQTTTGTVWGTSNTAHIFYTGDLEKGNYYNSQAASALGTSTSPSICPKGWNLPTYNSGQSYVALAKSYGLALSTNIDTSDNAFNIMTGFPLEFNYAGWYSSSGTFAPEGAGEFMTGTIIDSKIYYLRIVNNKETASAAYGVSMWNFQRSFGISIRCVAKKDNYTIAYSSNGADSGSPGKTSDTSVYVDGSITTPSQNTLAKIGYSFKGWALTADATTAAYTENQTISMSDLLAAASSAGQATNSGATITLYPIWKANTYNFSWNGNGGTASGGSTNGTYNGNVTTATATRSGHIFLGWAHSSTATTKTYDGNASTAVSTLASGAGTTETNNATITLYAVWEADIAYAGDCSSTVHPTTTQSCKMKDGKIWTFVSETRSYNELCTNQTNKNGHDASCTGCPAGYTFPKITDYDTLVKAYGGSTFTYRRTGYREYTGGVYQAIGRTDQVYWASTEYDSNNAYKLYLNSGYSNSADYGGKTYSTNLLCYKQS